MIVRNQQRVWALCRGVAIDRAGYTLKLNDNLFVPLSDDTRSEFSRGDGAELGVPGVPGKMQALHSSSALACNVFEYWRRRDASVLASALGLSTKVVNIEFEHKFPTGLPGKPPNLDVVLTMSDHSIIAVESKFLEPYEGRHVSGFKQKYSGCWGRLGYSRCQALASRLDSGDVAFRWLNAAQLLKHILGLAKSGLSWELLYLWYEVPGHIASKQHEAEVHEFAALVGADRIAFRSMTYQSLFAAMRSLVGESETAYLAYVADRYFGR